VARQLLRHARPGRSSWRALGATEKPVHIFLTGDFNYTPRALADGQTLLGMRIHPPPFLRTCCYDPGYGMLGGAYQFGGDYVT
jgi:hypothetical protein